MSGLGTLTKIEYQNLQQFIDSINRNFAVVQNSPLFKGIPGDDGDDGNIGPSGIRGSQIFFVNFVNFNLQFPTEVTLSSHIDLIFLNSKLSTNEGKTKILNAINSPNLVDKDIFVLTNSLLISYNYSENKFYDTGKSLNNSVTNEIQDIINNLFQSYLPQLQAGIKNVFENYLTLAKNYSDNNNTGLTTSINQTSVYSPFIQGITSNVGIPVDNHKYFGLSNNLISENNDNTIVFGNIIKYYKLLMNTINTDGSQTLTSDYAPGVNNIPNAIFLQDTYNSGLLFGYKGKNNLKTFGSIFKNESDELEIKSDSGKLLSDYSSLKLHKDRLRYNKLVQFNDSLELSNNIFIGGHINSKHIKTGYYSYEDSILSTELENNSNFSTDKNKYFSLGVNDNSTNYLLNNFNNIFLRATNYRGKVLITDNNGLISSSYILENKILNDYNTSVWNNLTEITDGNPNNRVLTTYYFNYLIRKINLLFNTQINGLYWTKAEFNTNIIPQLKLNDSLSVDKNASLAGIANFNNSSSRINFTANNFIINSSLVSFKNYLNKILVTDENGNLKNNINLDYSTFDTSTQQNINLDYPYLLTQNNIFDVITSHHYNRLVSFTNKIRTELIGNYWNKPSFESFIIPRLNVSGGLFSRNYLVVNKTINTNSTISGNFKNDLNNIFYVDGDNNDIYLGGTNTTLFSDNTLIKGFDNNQILGTINKTTLNNNIVAKITPFNLIGNISINNQTYNSLNSQLNKTIADNKTIASLILGINSNYDNLKNYIDNQISILNQNIQNQINNLSTDIYTKIQIINNDLINIHNELNQKADISYVDSNLDIINNNITNINNTLTQHQTDIDWIKLELNKKVDKSVFEPWKLIVDDFMSNTVQLPKGAIMIWEGKVINGNLDSAIPTGWEEVTSLRGRVPVGWTNGEYNSIFYGKFSVLGEEGGTAKYALVENENAPHKHLNRFGAEDAKTNGTSRTWLQHNPAQNGSYTQYTSSSGLGSPHENTQPYKVLIYIRSQKGISQQQIQPTGQQKIFWLNNNSDIGQNLGTSVRIKITVNGNVIINTINAVNSQNYNIESWNSINVNIGDQVKFEAIVESTSGNSIGNIWGHTTTGTAGTTATVNPTAPNTTLLFNDFMAPNFVTGHNFTHNFTIQSGLNYSILTDWFQ